MTSLLESFLEDGHVWRCRSMPGLILCFLIFCLLEMKDERKAVKETRMTAAQASTCRQNNTHTGLKELTEVRMADAPMMAIMIMTTLKQRRAPIPSFWRVLMRTFHSKLIGIVITRSVVSEFRAGLNCTHVRYL